MIINKPMEANMNREILTPAEIAADQEMEQIEQTAEYAEYEYGSED